jgi:predicted amidohydrolase
VDVVLDEMNWVQPDLVERDRHQLFNVAVLIAPDGEVIGKYRKVCLPARRRCEKRLFMAFSLVPHELGGGTNSIADEV